MITSKLLKKTHRRGCARATRFDVPKRTPQLIELRAPASEVFLSILREIIPKLERRSKPSGRHRELSMNT